jgi:hypothetical protein
MTIALQAAYSMLVSATYFALAVTVPHFAETFVLVCVILLLVPALRLEIRCLLARYRRGRR